MVHSAAAGGQYVFLNIPAISWAEFHPFSLSSAPGHTQVHLHVRVLGDWTRRLHTLASKVGRRRLGAPGGIGWHAAGGRWRSRRPALCF